MDIINEKFSVHLKVLVAIALLLNSLHHYTQKNVYREALHNMHHNLHECDSIAYELKLKLKHHADSIDHRHWEQSQGIGFELD